MDMYHEVSSFSGYTKGLYGVVEMAVEKNSASLVIEVPPSLCSKLEKRIKKFQSNAISIDGVAANATIVAERHGETDRIIATIAKEIFENSSLAEIRTSDRISIGLLSTNPEKYLLDASHPSKVQLKSANTLDEKIKFIFECTQEQYKRIKELQYIGLNGSAFFLKEPQEVNGQFYFSVYSYGETGNKTVFNSTQGFTDRAFTLTLPFDNKKS